MSKMTKVSAIEKVLEMIQGYDDNAEHNPRLMQFIQGVILGISLCDVIDMEEANELRQRTYDVYEIHKEAK